MRWQGEGVARDVARAMRYYRLAMTQQDPEQQQLGGGGGVAAQHTAANNLAELLVAEAVRGSSGGPAGACSSPKW